MKLRDIALTELQYIKEKYNNSGDYHITSADKVLCELLINLGFFDVVNKYYEINNINE